jgi:hypothetical protein
MSKRFTLFLAAAALGLVGAGARAGITNVENAYESSADHVSLPSVASGQVVVSECSGCKPVVLHANAATLYLIGAKNPPVTLEEMRKALRAPGADKRPLTVFYRLDNGNVTRVVLRAN